MIAEEPSETSPGVPLKAAPQKQFPKSSSQKAAVRLLMSDGCRWQERVADSEQVERMPFLIQKYIT